MERDSQPQAARRAAPEGAGNKATILFALRQRYIEEDEVGGVVQLLREPRGGVASRLERLAEQRATARS